MGSARTKRPAFTKIWLVCCDHSVAAVRRTKREAEAFIRFREDHGDAVDRLEHYVLGPFVLEGSKR